MRITRLIALLLGALALVSVLVVPARAETDDTLAAILVSDGCGAPTFDAVVTAAATALRGQVPAGQLAGFDQQVGEFRQRIAAIRVHRDGLPVDPALVGARPEFLDDPIVTYLVNGLDAVRTGRIHQTMSVSQLTVNDAIEVFVLATRIVKIPAQLAASMVPSVGILLKPIVGALFNGVKSLTRAVQDHLATQCAAPNAYAPLELGAPALERVELPAPVIDLANSLVNADESCTPVAELTTREVIERTRTYLAATDLPLDRAAMHAGADSLQAILAENRVTELLLLRRTEELGPLVSAADYGPLTFLTNLGFSLYEGKALNTVPLADIQVENAFDLALLALDVTSLLLTLGNTALGFTGVATTVTTPLSIVQTLAFAPTTYGAPILRGVFQSMCAA
ncbi:hypothetical protein ACFVMC_05465 [Nocardia sp. NPDC127579]|uniref:hypothetical protein n=1 Tax=Nocardia sp. NPDC127579 TaxID=3345402 RepID=UPI00362F4AC1